MSRAMSLKVWVAGTVQGVCYRASTREQARRLGVHGWVRNLPDGRVEAWLEGEQEAIDALLDWMRTGPPGAAVTRLDCTPGEPQGVQGFEVHR